LTYAKMVGKRGLRSATYAIVDANDCHVTGVHFRYTIPAC